MFLILIRNLALFVNIGKEIYHQEIQIFISSFPIQQNNIIFQSNKNF
jgi:hypothetical protein